MVMEGRDGVTAVGTVWVSLLYILSSSRVLVHCLTRY